MSWDTDYKREKCPCGKGYLAQEVRSDDWNRYEEGTPYIECEECKKKYKVVSIHFFELPWKRDGTAYYLVPIDLNDDAVYEHEFSLIQPYTFARNDFPKYLICSYLHIDLQAAENELRKISNCSLAKGTLSSIVKERRYYLKSCQKSDLLKDLEQAIDRYNEGANYEKICAESAHNDEKYFAFKEKIKKLGKQIF